MAKPIRPSRLLACVVAATLGCATAPQPIHTLNIPAPTTGTIDKRLEVLGVAARTTLGIVAGGFPPFTYEENYEIDAPKGTEVVIPVLNGWLLSYGVIAEQDLLTGNLTGTPADNDYGTGYVNVVVTDLVKKPGFNRAAKVHVQMVLLDQSGDEPWFGRVDYHLVFLGLPPIPLDEVPHPEPQPQQPGPPGPPGPQGVAGPAGAGAIVGTAFNATDIDIGGAPCPASVELTNTSIQTTVGKRILVDASLRFRNGAGGARTPEFRIRRGTSCTAAVDVETDGFSRVTLGGADTATLAWQNSEPSPGGAASYRLCGCTSGTGTQPVEYVRMTFWEF